MIILKVKGQTLTFNSIDSLVSIGRFKKVKLFLENQKNTFSKYEKLAELSEVLDDNERAISFLEKALTLKEEYKVRVKLIKLNSFRLFVIDFFDSYDNKCQIV